MHIAERGVRSEFVQPGGVLVLGHPGPGEALAFDTAKYSLIDFRRIAGKWQSLVQAGESLFIFFGDATSVELTHFFDERGRQTEVLLQIDDTTFFSPNSFLAAYDVIDEGRAVDEPIPAGAYFVDPAIDFLPPSVKLPLLPPEELPPIEFLAEIAPSLPIEALALLTPPDTRAPAITIAKTADPTTVNEGGQSVTYTYALTNEGLAVDPLTLTALVDDRGTLADTSDDVDLLTSGTFVGGDIDGDNLIDAGETWIYTYTTDVMLNAGASLTNVVTRAGARR